MKRLPIILFFFFLISGNLISGTWLYGQSYDINIIGPGSVKISGSSNVNKFTLSYTNSIAGRRQIIFGKNENNRQLITGANKISLRIDAFTSSNRIITSDFKKMLQEEKYPFINIEIARLINQPGEANRVFVMAILTIAGVQRLEILPVNISKKANDQLLLTSRHKISLRNYKLEPPKKIMGMVNVSDDVFIDISMVAQYQKN